MFTVTITAEQRELLLLLLNAHAAQIDNLFGPSGLQATATVRNRAIRAARDSADLRRVLLSAAPAGATPGTADPLAAAAGAAGGAE